MPTLKNIYSKYYQKSDLWLTTSNTKDSVNTDLIFDYVVGNYDQQKSRDLTVKESLFMCNKHDNIQHKIQQLRKCYYK